MSGASTLVIALKVLARLVREEYPAKYSLAEIASTWGMASPEEVHALELVEKWYLK